MGILNSCSFCLESYCELADYYILHRVWERVPVLFFWITP